MQLTTVKLWRCPECLHGSTPSNSGVHEYGCRMAPPHEEVTLVQLDQVIEIVEGLASEYCVEFDDDFWTGAHNNARYNCGKRDAMNDLATQLKESSDHE